MHHAKVNTKAQIDRVVEAGVAADLQQHRAAKLDGVLHLAQQVRHGKVEHPQPCLCLHVLHPLIGLPLHKGAHRLNGCRNLLFRLRQVPSKYSADTMQVQKVTTTALALLVKVPSLQMQWASALSCFEIEPGWCGMYG